MEETERGVVVKLYCTRDEGWVWRKDGKLYCGNGLQSRSGFVWTIPWTVHRGMLCKLHKESLWWYIFKYTESKPQTISTGCWSTSELQKSKEGPGGDWGTVICNITAQSRHQPHWKSLLSCSKEIGCAGFIQKYHSKIFHSIFCSHKEHSPKVPAPHYQQDYWIYERKNVSDNQVQRPEDQILKWQRLLSHTEFKGHLAKLEKVSAEWNSRLWSTWRRVPRPKLTSWKKKNKFNWMNNKGPSCKVSLSFCFHVISIVIVILY